MAGPEEESAFGLVISNPASWIESTNDLGALKIRRAERVDDDGDAVRLELEVALLGPGRTRARTGNRGTATLHRDPEDVASTSGSSAAAA